MTNQELDAASAEPSTQRAPDVDGVDEIVDEKVHLLFLR